MVSENFWAGCGIVRLHLAIPGQIQAALDSAVE